VTVVLEAPRHIDPSDSRVGLTEALREVMARLADSSASSVAFAEARDLVTRAAEVLSAEPGGRGYEWAEASVADPGVASFLDFSPLVGALNPLAPPMAVRIDDDGVVGEVVFGRPYEGPPGCVHGGFIAAAFDEVLGFAQQLSGNAGMTGRLSVSYRSPTPLGEPVRFRARLDRVEGRKIFVTATLHHGSTLCAEAEGLFVSMSNELFARLIRRRDPSEH
jgi:acyl-coenzyme A thioesterase PaaI-like protein